MGHASELARQQVEEGSAQETPTAGLLSEYSVTSHVDRLPERTPRTPAALDTIRQVI